MEPRSGRGSHDTVGPRSGRETGVVSPTDPRHEFLPTQRIGALRLRPTGVVTVTSLPVSFCVPTPPVSEDRCGTSIVSRTDTVGQVLSRTDTRKVPRKVGVRPDGVDATPLVEPGGTSPLEGSGRSVSEWAVREGGSPAGDPLEGLGPTPHSPPGYTSRPFKSSTPADTLQGRSSRLPGLDEPTGFRPTPPGFGRNPESLWEG